MAQNIDLKGRIPNYLRNEVLDSIFSNLFNRFVSQDDSIQVAGDVGNSQEAKIAAIDLEHEVNALAPGLLYQVGTERRLFVFDDLVNKLEALGVNTVSLRTWMAEQQFNFTPPIDYDKFVNYGSYRWVGDPTKDAVPSWNPELDPEYYLIARPKATDADKWPARLASTRNLNLWINDRPPETFVVTFTGATTFTVTSNIDPNLISSPTISFVSGVAEVTLESVDPGPSAAGTVPSVGLPISTTYPVVSFTVTIGSTPFEAGDSFTITHTHFTSQTTIEYEGAVITGKGSISGVVTETPIMLIDGVELEVGDRIVAKNQVDPTLNGIYIVDRGSQWIKAFDADEPAELEAGNTIYVSEGSISAGYTYTVATASPVTFSTTAVVTESPYNSWQIYNHWVHIDEMVNYPDRLTTSPRASRPIIEYDRYLHLNSEITTGTSPTDGTLNSISYEQTKTLFNQIPLFDLYYYDGHHSGYVSGIWYYVEDQTYPVDAILKRRIKTTSNSDFVFGHSLKDPDGRFLYYKKNGSLYNAWLPGVSSPEASEVIINNETVTTNVAVTVIEDDADQQRYTITMTSESEYTIEGSRSGPLGSGSINTVESFGDITVNVINDLFASVPEFIAGDVLTFNVYTEQTPRYVKKV